MSAPEISRKAYVKRLFLYCRCDDSVYILALIYLNKLRDKYPVLRMCHMNLHRLLITAIVIAAKMLQDETFTMTHYGNVGGVPTVGEMTRLEAAFLKFLDFKLLVNETEFQNEVDSLKMLVSIPHGEDSGDDMSEISDHGSSEF